MSTQFVKYLPLVVLLAMFACSTPPAGTDKGTEPRKAHDPNTIYEPESSVDLADHLRKFTGVQVIGSGATAMIRIRGTNSINFSSEPLFVLDGMPINGGFESVYTFVNVNDIHSITVLKDPVDLALYGVRGANGVIEIDLKK